MKKTLSLLTVAALMLSVCACGKKDDIPADNAPDMTDVSAETEISEDVQNQHIQQEKIYDYITFEEALAEYATDAVIAQYVKHTPFGESQTLVEYEFTVLERITGNAADTIYVYCENPEYSKAAVENAEKYVMFNPGDLSFDTETKYLLTLEKINNPLAFTHKDGYLFINDIVINLDAPSDSVMYSEPLELHLSSDEIDFSDDSLSEEEILSYVEELIEDSSSDFDDFTDSDQLIFEVEVGELLSAPRTDWIASDNYYVKVMKVLTGIPPSNRDIIMTFTADTVTQGERYYVIVEPIEQGYDDWFRLVSPNNALFSYEQWEQYREENNMLIDGAIIYE